MHSTSHYRDKHQPQLLPTIPRMGHIYLIRHGQASLGAEDYDQLSPLGQRQSERLGQYLRQRSDELGLQWDAVLMGSLRRHRQTWEGIAQGAGWTQHTPLVWPGLNEYDSEALLAALPVTPGQTDPGSPEGYKRHFRLLRDALAMWMAGTISPHGMPATPTLYTEPPQRWPTSASTTATAMCWWSAAAAPSPPWWATCCVPRPKPPSS